MYVTCLDGVLFQTFTVLQFVHMKCYASRNGGLGIEDKRRILH